MVEGSGAADALLPVVEPVDGALVEPDGPERVTTPPSIVLIIVTPAALIVVMTDPAERVAVIATPALVVVTTCPAVKELGRLTGPGARVIEGAPVEAGATVVVTTAPDVCVTTTTEEPGTLVSGCALGVAGTVILVLGSTGLGETVEGLIDSVTVDPITVWVSVALVTTTTVEVLETSCRLASNAMLVARGASSRCTASMAVWSSLKIPCWNFLGE